MATSCGTNQVESFFICGTPRTGTSFLLGLLDSTGVAGRPQTYFRPPDYPLWAERWGLPHRPDGGFGYADYVNAALIHGRTDNGVFSAKLMFDTHQQLLSKLAAIHPELAGHDPALFNRVFGRTSFVMVDRGDTVGQAVSWLRAEQTNTWYLGGNGEVGDNAVGGSPPSYSAEAITGLIKRIESHNSGWEDWFNSVGVEPFRVRYENLVADHTAVIVDILDYLGLNLPTGTVIIPRHHRQADELNEDWARRYRAARTAREAPHSI